MTILSGTCLQILTTEFSHATDCDIHAPRFVSPDFLTLMSLPSGYWDYNEINPAILNELAAIEASQVASTSKPMVQKPLVNLMPPPLTVG
jgi:hypothetical protein